MEFHLDAVGFTPPIKLNQEVPVFDVGVGVVTSDTPAFAGKFSVQQSPDGVAWFNTANWTDVTASEIGKLPYKMPWVRFIVNEITAGSITCYLYP